MAGFSYIDETTWKYVNLGTADLLTVSGTTVTTGSTKSRTGTAFYQTTRAKCFDIPAASELWIKADLYHTGSVSNRFRIYNGGSHGFSGICLQTDGNLNIFVNDSQAVAKIEGFKNELLQSYLVHMKSGVSDGLIEFWVDDILAATYTGNVNNGDDFADLYLQCDNEYALFSNVVISNIENVPLIYQAEFKPEIYATWIPKGNIAVKPEIYATVYRAPQLVKITGSTARTLKKTETASADSLRQIGTGIEVTGDSSRKIVKAENVSGDTARAIQLPQSISGDSRRVIGQRESISSDTFREVKIAQTVMGDTLREVFKFEPQIVRISGAAVRKLTRSEIVTADTLSINGVRNAATGATRRVVRFNVVTGIVGDLKREIASTAVVTADTISCVTRFERISGDAFKQVGWLNSVRADSFRQVKKRIRAVGDTRLAYGLRQNISADTLRQLSYAVWKTDETGSVIQINRPRGNHILIGEARTLSVSNWRVLPDDRQRKIETIGSVVVEDFGHIVAGDRISCTVTLDRINATVLESYWHSRIFVNVIDEAGREWENLRVCVKKYSYIPYFEKYYRATLEFWRE